LNVFKIYNAFKTDASPDLRLRQIASAKGGEARIVGVVRVPIMVKLLAAFTVPAALLFGLFAFVAHEVMRQELEAELGTRLAAVAALAATRLTGSNLAELEPGDEQHPIYTGARGRLMEAARATDAARLYVFDRKFRSRVDTAADVPIGSTYYHAELDRHELGRVFDRGAPVSSVLFQGAGGRLYKAGYAPVYASDRDRRVVLAVGVDAPADFFDRLSDLRRNLVIYGVGSALAIVLVAVVVAVLITRPVRQLADAAERIGRGDLARPIARLSRDEIGFLAETMERMRRDLRQRDERMQQMLSGIAHEVRNPLGGIELFSGILRDEIPPGDERRAHVERIEREVSYLSAVVTEFLDYARRPAPDLTAVELAPLAEAICELEQAEAEKNGVALSRQVPERLACLGDPVQLRRALHNLIRNAVQAAAEADGGSVAIRAEPDEDAVRLTVDNSGVPIPEHVRERMFEPFFTTREKGTGLGLAFAREIVLDLGGTIEVDSTPSGTRFTIRLRSA
jgi:signal transduction histidine kinase